MNNTGRTVEPVMPNRVPRVTAGFWLIKLLAATVGETATDFLTVDLGLGPIATGLIRAGIIAAVAAAFYAQAMNGILAFWIAYIVTRPFGASIGDLQSQPADAGGMTLGTIVTSAAFLAAIGALILYASLTRSGTEIVPAVRRG